MGQITLYLDNSNKAQFCEWLTDYCHKMQVANKHFPYMTDEWQYALYYRSPISPDYDRQLEIPAHCTKFTLIDKAEEEYKMEHFDINEAIKLSWLEVGTRLKVVISHHGGSWIIPPLFDIFAEIGQDWQGVRSELWKYMNELAERFDIELTSMPFPLDNDITSQENIIADNFGGTLKYKRNEKVQVIPTGGAINPGYKLELGEGVSLNPEESIYLNHTTGNLQPGLYPPEAKDTIIQVTTETLAGLIKNADDKEARASAKKPKRPKKKKRKIKLPSRLADAHRWVLTWDLIESQIEADPTLKIDYDELRDYLKARSINYKGYDTLAKIIKLGRAGKIPPRLDFERKYKL